MTTTTHADYDATTPAADVAAAFPKNIEGRTILITGVNRNGIGFSTAEAFASQSPRCLILAGRTPSKIEECAKHLSATYPNIEVKTLELDLSSQASVRSSASTLLSWQDVPRIDLLINNAGIMNLPTLQHTPEGIEMQFGTNHIGHFLFTNLIISKIIAAAKANPTKGATRIINVSSRGVGYGPVRWSDLTFEKPNETLPESEQPNCKPLLPTSHAQSRSERKLTQPNRRLHQRHVQRPNLATKILLLPWHDSLRAIQNLQCPLQLGPHLAPVPNAWHSLFGFAPWCHSDGACTRD